MRTETAQRPPTVSLDLPEARAVLNAAEATVKVARENIVSEPNVINVSEMPGDQECIEKAQANLRTANIGDIALGETVRTKRKPIRNIHEAALWAKEGDDDGHAMVETNVRTDAMERIFKAGNIITVRLEIDTRGRVLQHGQLVDDVHRNAYQMASADTLIKGRTEAEANNGARIKELRSKGYLEDHALVAFSLCEEGISDTQLDKLGFFSETKSLSMQATSEDENGLYTESAFVAGIKELGGERTDRQVIEEIGDLFGVDYRDKTAAEIINMPLLIPKNLMPNGVVDLVRLYDGINGQSFFGQDKPALDYVEFKEFCKKREAGFADDVQRITTQLISEVEELGGPEATSRRLGKLVEESMVHRAVSDTSIEARVFGPEAATFIDQARVYWDRGQHEMAQLATIEALRTAKSSSCPSALESDNDLTTISMSNEGDIIEVCEFISKECPKCGEKNVKTTSTKTQNLVTNSASTHVVGSCGCSVRK